jgi:hypothetical protein
VWQRFCDRLLKKPLLTVSRSFMNLPTVCCEGWRLFWWQIKLIFFVSSVLFDFWYHSPNFFRHATYSHRFMCSFPDAYAVVLCFFIFQERCVSAVRCASMLWALTFELLCCGVGVVVRAHPGAWETERLRWQFSSGWITSPHEPLVIGLGTACRSAKRMIRICQ